MNNKLSNYCKQHEISIIKLSEISGVNMATLYKIDNNPMFNCTVKTVNAIYTSTKKAFGDGLMAYEYLDWDFLKLPKRVDKK